ncbi:MAG: hypothetical protein WCB02_36335 [Bradyrhizobium sp.]
MLPAETGLCAAEMIERRLEKDGEIEMCQELTAPAIKGALRPQYRGVVGSQK